MLFIWKRELLLVSYCFCGASQVVLVAKNPPANPRDVRDSGLDLWLRKIPGGGHGNLPLYSCLETPMDRGAWRATVPGVAKSWIWLKRLSTLIASVRNYHKHSDSAWTYNLPILEAGFLSWRCWRGWFFVEAGAESEPFWSQFLEPASLLGSESHIKWAVYPLCSHHHTSFFRPSCLPLLWILAMTFRTPLGLPWWLRWLRICLQCRRPGFDPWMGKIPWRKEWQPTPVFLPLELHGQKRLVGYSPWGQKELDMTEWLTLSLSLDNPESSPHFESLDLITPTESPHEVKSTGSRS